MTLLLPALCAVVLCQPPAADQQPPSPPPATTPHQDAALDRLTAAAEVGDHWAMFLMNCVYSAYLDEQTPVEGDLPADKRPLWDLAAALVELVLGDVVDSRTRAFSGERCAEKEEDAELGATCANTAGVRSALIGIGCRLARRDAP